MKYYPKLKIWKNSTNTCTFDGKTAWSYQWYCIAIKLPNNTWVINSYTYSIQTAKHIYAVERLLKGETIVKVRAPIGLTDTDRTEVALCFERTTVTEKLKRARARKPEYQQRLVEIEQELLINQEISKLLCSNPEERLPA